MQNILLADTTVHRSFAAIQLPELLQIIKRMLQHI